MRLLLDSCMSPGAAVELRAEGHDVIWAGDWPVDPGDDEVLRRAHVEGRVLITLDKDFGELAVALRRAARRNCSARGLPSGGTGSGLLPSAWPFRP